jgi:hypothetical protein
MADTERGQLGNSNSNSNSSSNSNSNSNSNSCFGINPYFDDPALEDLEVPVEKVELDGATEEVEVQV